MTDILITKMQEMLTKLQKSDELKYCLLTGVVGFVSTITTMRYYNKFQTNLQKWREDHILPYHPCITETRTLHDKRRGMTYPEPISNTWYHLCDSSDLKPGEDVIEIRALGQTFAVWRTKEGSLLFLSSLCFFTYSPCLFFLRYPSCFIFVGKPVCQTAFCVHVGANLAVGGKIEDDCIRCPFHHWKFDQNGNVVEIPYKPDPKECSGIKQKLKTYECMDWCGLVMVYFHAEGTPSEEVGFPLPTFIPDELKKDGWRHHLTWDIGKCHLFCVDFSFLSAFCFLLSFPGK
jgi:nitrite reductase/ring-hydroxylating ferredoxin subunit